MVCPLLPRRGCDFDMSRTHQLGDYDRGSSWSGIFEVRRVHRVHSLKRIYVGQVNLHAHDIRMIFLSARNVGLTEIKISAMVARTGLSIEISSWVFLKVLSLSNIAQLDCTHDKRSGAGNYSQN